VQSDVPDEHWQTVYREKDEGAVSWFQERASTSLDFIRRAGLAKGASIVDVGGGASHLVDGLLDSGYEDVTVVDIAPAALSRSKARLAGRAHRVKWVASDLRSWTPETTFDLWHDRAVFHFMSPEDRRAYLETMRRAMKPSGHAVIATFATDGPERCSGLSVQRYDPPALAAALGPEFRLIESLREAHETPWGTVLSFQYSRFERTP